MINNIKNSKKLNISFLHYKNKSKFSILFCPGFNSDMFGKKAQEILSWCKNKKIECVLFDYSGHGKSSGNIKILGIKDWISDTQLILKSVITKPTIVIGSSMGGWIALRVGIQNPKKIIGLIGIASAPDFTENLWHNILNKKQKMDIKYFGHTFISSKYNPQGYVISKKLIEDGKKSLLMKNKYINLKCPVKLIHGNLDEEGNIQNSFDILDKIRSNKAELTVIKNGDHRLSKPENLKTIINVLQNLKDELLLR